MYDLPAIVDYVGKKTGLKVRSYASRCDSRIVD